MPGQLEQDERSIEKALRLYTLAMDARRWDLFDDIFTHNIVADYLTLRWTDLSTFKRDFAALHADFDATQHAVMTPLIEVDSDTAASFAYVSYRLIKCGTKGGDFAEGQAWYNDHWVRTAKGWLIQERACRVLWSDGNPGVRLPTAAQDIPAATSANSPVKWNLLREDAAQAKVGFLAMYDKRTGRL